MISASKGVKTEHKNSGEGFINSHIRHYIKTFSGSSLVAQWLKDPASSLLWLRLLLYHRFDPWTRNFCMPRAKQNKTTKKKNFYAQDKYFRIQ